MTELIDAEHATYNLPADVSLLLLDDDAALRTRLGRALEKRGFNVTMAGSVAEALDAMRAAQPAFAVLDLRLEDGDSLSVVEELRKRRPDSKIVILTGEPPPETLARPRGSSPSRAITKKIRLCP